MISAIDVTQTNYLNGSDLMPIHSPLTFIIDVTFSGAVPEVITVEIYDQADQLLGTYRAIAYRDLTVINRQFVFHASEALRRFMGDFDDLLQASDTLISIPDVTKFFKLRFVDPDNPGMYGATEFTAIHAAAQFGEPPNKDTIHNNATDLYYGSINGFTYVYFYVKDPSDTLTITVT